MYAFESPLFYNHLNHENDVTIIPFAMGIRQSDPFGGMGLFILAYFRALHSIANHFPYFLFSSVANDTHIIGPPSIVSSIYKHFQTKFHAIGLSI